MNLIQNWLRAQRGTGLLSLVFMIFSVLVGCSDPIGPANVVLITVDTLRPDRLHYNGYARPTSPALDQLAAEGLVFPISYSVSGWTMPAIASILTGRYPKDHLATDFRLAIDSGTPTLAELLKHQGYTTKAYVSHFMLNEGNGFARGFDVFDVSVIAKGSPHNSSSSKEITDLALAGIRDAQSPYFIWAHYFDPHFEYLVQPAFSLFGTSEGDLYDQEIAFTDLHIGRLLDELEDDNTIVIFTADHGEEFGEHSGSYHYTLHDEVMRTPFIIKAPMLRADERGVDVETGVVEQTDIVPTLLALLGIEADPKLPGRDLLKAAEPGRPAFFERDRPPPWRQRGVRVGDRMLFVVDEYPMESIPRSKRGTHVPVLNVKPGTYLYDLASDPEERINLYDENDAKSLELLGLVAAHFQDSRSPTSEIELDEKTREKLRALGYIE
jgi:arylsulfatase A-like enzyme